ncbi:MAG: DUF5916 domain-containing protein [Gemmatimonadota bacterium]|jgi:hypothetical protein
MGVAGQIVTVAVAVAVLVPIGAHGQQNMRSDDEETSGAAASAAIPAMIAVRTDEAIVLDGRLDESLWAASPSAPRLTQTDPDEGAPPTERSDVRIAFDADALYIGAFLYDRGPIKTRLARRDASPFDADWFAVSLDTYHDHLTAYRFGVNPSGVKRDEVMTGSSGYGGDTNWDPVWDVATAVTDSGWSVEMRIPLSQLRFSQDSEQVWGLQVERRIDRNHEQDVLAFTPRTERGGVARYGHLRGIGRLDSGRHRLELLPYVLGRADYRSVARSSSVDFANPFNDGSLLDAGFGVDLKFRPTPNTVVDGTVNPDFGQVEVDPAVINLTAFETRFDEKRPFFVEGADMFHFGGSNGGRHGGGFGGGGGGGGGGSSPSSLLYSRRIGRAPQGHVPDEAVYSDRADATTIVGAGKLTTRLAGGWSVAVLDALTAKERATFVDVAGSRGRTPIEPLTNYMAGRIRRDFRDGESAFGAMLTSVNRDLGDEALAERLRSAAYTGGLDFRHEWANRTWSVFGYAAGSYIRGTPDVLVSAQRSSARYFQRPDADYVDVDSAATSLKGYAAHIDIGKRAGTWRGNASLTATSPGYEINDLGFLTGADRVSLDLNLNYEQTVPGRVFRRWSVRLGPRTEWNFGGDRTGGSLGLGGSGQLSNFWGFGYNLSHRFESIDDRLTRGGVRALEPSQNSGFLFFSSDSRRALTARVSINGQRDAAGGWRLSTGVDFGIKPADNWEIRIGPDISRSYSAAQYVTSVTDQTAIETAGERYVFAPIRQTTVSMDTRLNVTFTPELSLELFAQPFLSSGDYGDLAELRRPASFEFAVYGRDRGTLGRDDHTWNVDPDGAAGPAPSFSVGDYDFNYRSLRGNAVLRWEWAPGSTIYLVWQQNRSQRTYRSDDTGEDVGTFALEHDARRMFGLRPDNVFMIKASWWWNP